MNLLDVEIKSKIIFKNLRIKTLINNEKNPHLHKTIYILTKMMIPRPKIFLKKRISKAAARPDSSSIQFVKYPVQGNLNHVILDTIGHNWKCGSWDWIQFLTLIQLKLLSIQKNSIQFSIKMDLQGEMNPVQHSFLFHIWIFQ